MPIPAVVAGAVAVAKGAAVAGATAAAKGAAAGATAAAAKKGYDVLNEDKEDSK